MTKKLTCQLCAVLLAVAACSLCACGNASQNNASTQNENANASSNSAVQNKNTGNAASNAEVNGSVYKEVLFGNILVQFPSDWKSTKNEGVFVMSKNGAGSVPFFSVEAKGSGLSESDLLTSQMNTFKEKYGNQMAKPPASATLTVAGKDLTGFSAQYSAKDASGTITHEEYVEVIDGATYHFVCEYVSGATGNQSEDETTRLAFTHAIETMKIKSS